MINLNLKRIRIQHQYTTEELAEKLGVSRQVIGKWEKGESTPDLQISMKLAEHDDVTLDNLVSYNEEDIGLAVPPKGKDFFGATTVGERGQIVIPKKAREIFQIEPGDTLIVVGDRKSTR